MVIVNKREEESCLLKRKTTTKGSVYIGRTKKEKEEEYKKWERGSSNYVSTGSFTPIIPFQFARVSYCM